jgi:hypothetical protein
MVALGAIRKTETVHQQEVDRDIAAFIPVLEKLLESGQLKPMEYEILLEM